MLDDVRFYNVDLNDSDIGKIYNNGYGDQAPSVTSYDGNGTVALNALENQSLAAEVNASDPNGRPLAYSLGGGPDQSLFEVNASTGEVTFKTPPDFEQPGDANADNLYQLTVLVSNGLINSSQDLNVTVTDDDSEDRDGDGFSDGQEATAGTSPDDPASKPGLNFGLLGYWPLDGNASDLSGNGRDGSPKNGAAFVSGAVGQGLYFDGHNDYFTVPTFELGGSMSIVFWGKFAQFQDWDCVMDFANSSTSKNLKINCGNSGSTTREMIFEMRTPSGNRYVGEPFWVLNEWVHLVLTVDVAGTMKLYRTGKLVDTETGSGLAEKITRSKHYFGKSTYNDNKFRGELDEIRIYDRALTAGEAMQLAQAGNSSPTDLNASSSLTIAENQPVGTIVGEFNATDPDAWSTLTYHLVNGVAQNDNHLFTLDTNGTLKTAVTFDFESNATIYSIRARVTDEQNASVEGNFTVTLTNANEAPVITSPSTANIPENQTFVLDVNASDPDDDTITYSISGGPDAAKFDLNSGPGALTFLSAPDYENPTDADANNAYVVEVNASDGTASVSQTVTVTVTDIVETSPSRPVVYVKSSAPGGGDGQSWATAYNQLRDALPNAPGGSDVWVAQGTYFASSSNAQSSFFTINSKDLRIYGGFAGTETSLTQRDLLTNHTVLSADYGQNDSSDPIYTGSTRSENGHHVFWIEDSNATLDGLTIEGGNADLSNVNGMNNGGGMYAKNSKVKIFNCHFTLNSAVSYGGGIYTIGSETLVSNSVFFNNNGGYNGAGAVNIGQGGSSDTAKFINTFFINNNAQRYGAVFVQSNASADFINCVFAGNRSYNRAGSGAFASYGSGHNNLINCTFYDNSASPGEGVTGSSNATFSNSVFWNNGSSALASAGVVNSIVQNGYSGAGNLDQDPLFSNVSNLIGEDGRWGTADDGLRLTVGSPAIDGGLLSHLLPDFADMDSDGNFSEVTPFDVTGLARNFGASPSLGAYEEATAPPNSAPVITSYGGAATASVNAPENQTFAADVNASDADGNATVSYSISGGADQAKFDLNATTGVLTFETAPDFEIPTDADANNDYLVIVQATDGEANATQTLTVTVTDIYESTSPPTQPTDGNQTESDQNGTVPNQPVDQNQSVAPPPVDNNQTQTDQNGTGPAPGDPTPTLFRPLPKTLPHEELANGNFRLWGMILADGGSPVTEVAFELADNMVFRNSTLHSASMLAGSPNFFGEITLEPGKRYYYRAVASNAMGTTSGSPKRLTTPPSEARWWTNAPEISGGWRNSSWLGAFRPYDNGWIYHNELGWAYAHPDGSSGLWLWFRDHHWMWTRSGVFPYLWKHDLGTWHYLLGTRNGQPVFYEWTESGNSNTFLFLP